MKRFANHAEVTRPFCGQCCSLFYWLPVLGSLPCGPGRDHGPVWGGCGVLDRGVRRCAGAEVESNMTRPWAHHLHHAFTTILALLPP